MVRLNVILDDELHRRFKIAAVSERKHLTELVREWIRQYVEQAEKKTKRK